VQTGQKNTYASYLQVTKLLDAQHLSTEYHDELLFIIIHQTHELWFKLAIHELDFAIHSLMQDRAGEKDCILAFKVLNRVNEIQKVLIASWSVLATLTPDEFFVFRETVGRDNASGFQSAQYRIFEFKLGHKYTDVAVGPHTIRVVENATTPEEAGDLSKALHSPSIYDAVVDYLAKNLRMFEIARISDHDTRYRKSRAVFQAWDYVYKNRSAEPELYQLGEKLIDIEDGLRKWRFAHLAAVARIIGGMWAPGVRRGWNICRRWQTVPLSTRCIQSFGM
jgi:tryptophan 2,3-dioxygenase